MSDNKDNSARSLTLEIDGTRIPAPKFLKSISLFFEIIKDVAEKFVGEANPVYWTVKVREGSANIDLMAESISPHLSYDHVPTLVAVIQTGFAAIEQSSVKPPYFSDDALKKAKVLGAIANGEVKAIRIRKGSLVSPVTARTSANIASLFVTAYQDWGSVDGELQVVSKKGVDHVQLYDDLTGRYIKCRVTKEMLRDMLPAFRDGDRVSLYGLIRYYETGRIKDIEVEKFRIFPKPETLPSFADVCGILGGAD